MLSLYVKKVCNLFLLNSVPCSCSVMSVSLRLHELQHTRPPCPSPTPGVHLNACPLSWWCHPTISSSVIPFSSCPQSLPASESFPMSQLFAWGGQSTGVSASASILQCSAFLTVQLSHPYMTIGKTIALTRRTFVGKVMPLLSNMVSRLVITFLPRGKHLLISWLQSLPLIICIHFTSMSLNYSEIFHSYLLKLFCHRSFISL